MSEAGLPTPKWDEVPVGLEVTGTARPLDAVDMALGISGSQDWNRVHLDEDYARQSGHDHVFFNTGWTSGTLGRVVTDWAGTEGWVRRFEFRMKRMISPGDTVQAKAKVAGKRQDPDGTRLVDLEVWLETDRSGVTTTGTAVVSLPC